ncbi:amyloid fiber anchoring/assembly protein TapA [Radiobacillus sp. PE A8.2]|uniref:amyloid fiber anchoring/assembly protein TapA n=1 Tax=Radiobacillus sp. PE A8.2 TaxID=3380349 RepID=UPI00388D5E1C
MRESRVVKYRKRHRKLIVITQVIVISYGTIVTFSLLSSNTSAYYGSTSKVNAVVISSDDWYDYSFLQLVKNGTVSLDGCSDNGISVEIMNVGSDMTRSSSYEVYFSNNDEGVGDKITSGSIEPMKNGEKVKLMYEGDQAGAYTFKIFQRTGFENKDEEQAFIWSEKIKICTVEENVAEESLTEPANREQNTGIKDDGAELGIDKQQGEEKNQAQNDNLKEEEKDEEIEEENQEEVSNNEQEQGENSQDEEAPPKPNEQSNTPSDEKNGTELQAEINDDSSNEITISEDVEKE